MKLYLKTKPIGERPEFPEGIVRIASKKGQSFDIKVKIANTKDLREYGLMSRQAIAIHSGMLFIYDENPSKNYWIKNIQFSLDLIFLDENQEIIKFIEKVPETTNRCESFFVKEPYKYVLQINGGFLEQNEVDEDARIRWIK